MGTSFPLVRSSRRGYDPEEVEEFIARARRAYTDPDGEGRAFTSAHVRRAAFGFRKGGYSIAHVDSALERLEDAFAERERQRHLAELGPVEFYGSARSAAQEILDRVVRPRSHRFRRVGPLTVGYSHRDVDAFTDRIAEHLQGGEQLAVDEIREVVFRSQRGGYFEAQVDVLLDTMIAVSLAAR